MTRTLLAVGVAIQALALASIKIDTPLSWQAGWIALSLASLLGIGFVVVAAVTAKQRPAFRTFAFLGSAAGAVGWASWLLVALTSEQGDPVINITGLLCIVGYALTFGAVVVGFMPAKWARSKSHYTWAWVFALIIAAFQAATYLHYVFGSDEYSSGWFFATITLPFAIGVAQIALAVRAQTESIARPMSIASGIVLVIGSLMFSSMAAWLSIGLSVAATITELQQSGASTNVE